MLTFDKVCEKAPNKANGTISEGLIITPMLVSASSVPIVGIKPAKKQIDAVAAKRDNG